MQMHTHQHHKRHAIGWERTHTEKEELQKQMVSV